jgi:hypothetical protein
MLIFSGGMLGFLSVLFVAGLGAAGSVKGAWRYIRIWVIVVGGMALAGVVLSLIIGFTVAP